jgi:hypothetical protein
MKYAALCVGLAFGLAGCLQPDYGGPAGGYSDPCQQFTSCGTCTPVLGCGWCWSGSKGTCVSEPNECANAPTFEWTWESAGCPAGDAGATPDGGAKGDAGTTSDAGATSDADAPADIPSDAGGVDSAG